MNGDLVPKLSNLQFNAYYLILIWYWTDKMIQCITSF